MNPEKEGLLLCDGPAWERACDPQHGGGGAPLFLGGQDLSPEGPALTPSS